MRKDTFLVLWAIGLAAWICGVTRVQAYETYHDPALDGQGYCATCHSSFVNRGQLHDLHVGNNAFTGTCNLCHTGSGRNNPFTLWSGDGTDPTGCVGCHGRDYGETIELPDGFDNGSSTFDLNGLPKASGYGLREFHTNAGVSGCVACHADVDPSFIRPESEDPPLYYRADVNIGDACNTDGSEDGTGEPNGEDDLGLDNDGDTLYDGSDPDCQTAPEADCFDGADNDADGLTDCADPDCAGELGGPCDTGAPGICASGTFTCDAGVAICLSDQDPQPEGPFGTPSCTDGMDNDCDDRTDAADPDCDQPVETECFDGQDNDADGATDCADPDCAGAEDGPCDTGDPGICAAGTRICQAGIEVCAPGSAPQPEEPFGTPACEDGLDNDCDGFTDGTDPDCEAPPTDCPDDDVDGFVVCDGTCAPPADAQCGDCDDSDPLINPAAVEGPFDSPTCNDAKDNDCDGLVDGEDSDCEPPVADCPDGDGDGFVFCDGVCSVPADLQCGDCDDGDAAVNPAATEGPFENPTCNDLLDNDCDGAVDADDPECRPAALADYDFTAFRCSKRARVGRNVTLRLQVANRGSVDPGATLTVYGVRADGTKIPIVMDLFFKETVDDGSARFRFTHVATAADAGKLTWYADIADEDSDNDLATCQTQVAQPRAAGAVRRDASRPRPGRGIESRQR